MRGEPQHITPEKMWVKMSAEATGLQRFAEVVTVS